MSLTVRFCGAARTVTGSCFLFDTGSGRLLVDCGLFQGPKTLKALNYGAFPFRPADIDAVLLTHAHIDHSGLLPKLVLGGIPRSDQGDARHDRPVLLSPARCRKHSGIRRSLRSTDAIPRAGGSEVRPIYTQADAVASLDAFRPVEYETWFEVMRGVRARYWNAGHLLGSASIEMEFAGEGPAGQSLRVLVSGDIGPDAKLLQPDPEAPAGFDYVISELTYGNIDRPPTTPQARRAASCRRAS